MLVCLLAAHDMRMLMLVASSLPSAVALLHRNCSGTPLDFTPARDRATSSRPKVRRAALSPIMTRNSGRAIAELGPQRETKLVFGWEQWVQSLPHAMLSLGWNVARSYLTSPATFRLLTHSAENTLTSEQQQSTSPTMSGFEIAGLVLTGAQIGASIVSKLSSGGS